MSGQRSIPKHKLARAASLTMTGAKIGMNYVRHVGKSVITGDNSREEFHERTASDAYASFSKLKGGPLKLAQMLSLDTELLPKAYIDQFSKAQYTAPPLSYPLVARTFRREFGKGPEEMFDHFEKEAAAGASIGQVHRARKDGRELAVKIQYPGVAASLDNDLRMVRPIASRMFSIGEKALEPYFKEVRERLNEETDYALELRRSIELAKASSHLPGVRFPTYYPDLCSSRILVMDWIDGMHLDQYANSLAPAEEKQRIAQTLWDFYDFQIHELRNFHADPHPGNFIISDGELWILDFGCVKQLDEKFYQDYFALMDPQVTDSDDTLDSLLERLGVFLSSDTPQMRDRLRPIFRESTELLSRPFHSKSFDFGDVSYLEEIRAFGERTRKDKEIQKLQAGRGNSESLYVNRSYFGLYNLMGLLEAKINARLPSYLVDSAA